MERTTLELGNAFMRSIPGLRLETVHGKAEEFCFLNGDRAGMPGFEDPNSTRYRICVKAKASAEFGGPTHEVWVDLSLTSSQLAIIVKQYFAVTLQNAPKVFREQLERLLRKRWTVMTDTRYKTDPKGGCPCCEERKPYWKISDHELGRI